MIRSLMKDGITYTAVDVPEADTEYSSEEFFHIIEYSDVQDLLDHAASKGVSFIDDIPLVTALHRGLEHLRSRHEAQPPLEWQPIGNEAQKYHRQSPTSADRRPRESRDPVFLPSLDALSNETIENLIERALHLKTHPDVIQRDLLRGKTLALYFEKKSTRTRLSSTVVFQNMGGSIVDISPGTGIHCKDAEDPKVSFAVISSMVDIILARVNKAETLDIIRVASANVHVLNALCDQRHPLQVLADLMTIVETKCADMSDPPDATNLFKGLMTKEKEPIKVAWMGDNNNVYKELAATLPRFGIQFRAAIPRGCLQSNAQSETMTKEEALEGANYIMTDTYVSMGEEAHTDAKLALLADHRIDRALCERADPDWKPCIASRGNSMK
ncbi:ornithine carbamoyltransferase [Rhizophlyctis rosea]|nr:ornithine carbamoyltransferase [Rhizophlyctis rosea]